MVWGMNVPPFELFILLATVLCFVTVVVVLRRRRGSINEHPYRDPYGDAPAAGRRRSPARDVTESLQSARGTR